MCKLPVLIVNLSLHQLVSRNANNATLSAKEGLPSVPIDLIRTHNQYVFPNKKINYYKRYAYCILVVRKYNHPATQALYMGHFGHKQGLIAPDTTLA